ncbi:hypothetical protein [Flagellimonas onchidii]|uniref:hypothetical protein n=1 Tax=Flagellimonas onchidii TaxID=2562684 RepID=UPI0010A5B53A|nr:hypothetical protein [Allomuricauda onchidii]
MTLIIGSKTKKYAIIGSDSQLTHFNGSRNICERTLYNKIEHFKNNLMFSFLGNWDDLREQNLKEFKIKLRKSYNKISVSKRMIKSLNKDVLVFGVKGGFFGISFFEHMPPSSDGMSKVYLDRKEYRFNEPNLSHKGIESIENQLIKDAKGNNSSEIENDLFVINNIILREIVKGRDLDILPLNNNANTVGGYVTIKILKRDLVLGFFPQYLTFNLYSNYKGDSLLDNISNPFSNLAKQEKVRFIDNLAMIVKSIVDEKNKKIKVHLIEWLKKQIHYLEQGQLLDTWILNFILEQINCLYGIKIDKFEIEVEEEVLGGLILDEVDDLNREEIKQFFTD